MTYKMKSQFDEMNSGADANDCLANLSCFTCVSILTSHVLSHKICQNLT